MELIYRITLFIAGVINLLPSMLAFLPDKISKSYGIEIPNANYELLLRHRAILFGIIGGLMIFSAIVKKYYDIATIAGLISMTSFIILRFKSLAQQITKSNLLQNERIQKTYL
jgi:hypothetical protein